MPSKQPERRSLPKKRNPLLSPENTPEHDELIKRRRLGQTNLAVKPGQVGTSNATKPENLGKFDYAHLRAPLPENLKGSEIFAPQQHQAHPEAYFLMRRSSDGYVSATGMFKAAFPWAKHSEEQAERDYVKSLETTSQDEVAGNVWIPESFALELADEYGIVAWVAALLDEAPVAEVKAPQDDSQKSISPPPKFIFTANDRNHLPNSHAMHRAATPRARGRPRATSPLKGETVPGKVASPRKIRATKANSAANAAAQREASASLQSALDTAASTADSESVDDDKVVTVEVDSAVQVNGEVETTTTNVKVEMAAGSTDLPLPQTPEEMIEKAKKMVEEARKLEPGPPRNSKSLKRKADQLEDGDEEEEEVKPAKKARILERQLQEERNRTRSILGVTTAFALAAVLPFQFVV